MTIVCKNFKGLQMDKLDKIIQIIHQLKEDAMATPTNNVSGGKIAGTPAADPGNPPVRKKNRYIFPTQKGYRSVWKRSQPKV
jgi:hypothetical protein